MKRAVKSVLCLVLVLSMFLCLCACSSGDKDAAVGKYEVVSMEAEGMTIDKEMIDMIFGDVDFYIELKADGTGVLAVMGESEEIGWADGKMWPAEDKSDTIEYTLKGKTLTLEIEGSKMVFEKK